MKKKPLIIVIGSFNTDMVIKTKKFPLPGETILGGTFFMFPGGKGANQAVAAARIGGEIAFLARVGLDMFGREAIINFAKEGINTEHITSQENVASGAALITVNEDGENSIVVAPGANNMLLAENISEARGLISLSEIILLQLEVPLESVVFAAELAKSMGKKVILNPAPARVLPTELFPCLYLITPNESEAFLLTGVEVNDSESAEKAADVFLKKGVENVIITLGAKGAYFKNEETSFMTYAKEVEVIDTTAAGDVFNGCLAVFIAERKLWSFAIQLACNAASASVTKMGAQSSAPYRNEILNSK